MSWPGRRRVRTAVSWLKSRLRGRGLILGYHRLDPPRHDPFTLSVSPAAFRAHLAAIVRHGHPVRLSDLVRGVRSGTVRNGTVVVTFDDAYADTMHVLEPLLREYGVPATVFVSTGLVGREPWWEHLHRILSRGSPLPEEIALRVDGVELVRALDASERGSEAATGARGRLVLDCYRALRSASDDVRDQALADMERWAGGKGDGPAARVVTAEELVELDRSEWIDVGSHTASHPVLAELPLHRQRDEIESSRRYLEHTLGHPVETFSYPNGSRSPETRDLVRAAGYAGACASQPGAVTTSTDVYALPRFWPGDDAHQVEGLIRLWGARR